MCLSVSNNRNLITVNFVSVGVDLCQEITVSLLTVQLSGAVESAGGQSVLLGCIFCKLSNT
jgi:hypothetical protein